MLDLFDTPLLPDLKVAEDHVTASEERALISAIDLCDLAPFRFRAAAFAGLNPDSLIQALLIRYDPGAGIGWHRDRPIYEHVIGLSLGEPANMRFRRRRPDGGFDRMPVPLAPDVGCKHRPKPVPPVADGFMADVDPAFGQQVFTLSKLRGNRTYIITTSLMISGDELK